LRSILNYLQVRERKSHLGQGNHLKGEEEEQRRKMGYELLGRLRGGEGGRVGGVLRGLNLFFDGQSLATEKRGCWKRRERKNYPGPSSFKNHIKE